MGEILFYGKADPFYEFSNFYESPFVVKGVTYFTAEHYFQSKKFWYKNSSQRSTQYGQIITCIKSPAKIKILATQKKIYRFPWQREMSNLVEEYKDVSIRSDWENVKEKIMKEALRYKFSDPKLRKILLSTGRRVLKENSPYDYIWGIGREGSGKNLLGKLLMELREEIGNDRDN